MRIAVWHNTPSGGARRALYYHVRGLVARGHEVESWCPSTADPSYLPLGRLAPEHVVQFDSSPEARNGPIWRYVRAFLRMREMDRVCKQAAREIQEGRFDVLLANSCFYYAVPFIVRYLNMPKAVYLQEPFRRFYEAGPVLPWIGRAESGGKQSLAARPGSFVADQFELQGIRIQARREWTNAHSCDAILVNSHYSRESVLRAYGRDAKVCYLGIDTALFRNQRRRRENFVVGLGAFLAAKGIDLAIKSIAKLPEPRPKLVWIGNGGVPGHELAMKRLADSCGVKFEARRLITDSELVETLNRAALLVYTSRLEPFGFAPLEANACGAPVVAVAEGGVRESVSDGLNGFLVDSEPAAIARAMNRLLRDPVLAKSMGERACEYVQREWNVESSVDRLEANLLRVVGGARSKAACFGH